MKQLKFQWILSITIMSILIALSSCSGEDGIDGQDGATGAQGLTGAQGEQGEVGPAGTDGSVIYSGESTPMEDTGVSGDYYLNISTGELYGPKQTDDSWENSDAFSLMVGEGSNGEDGKDGEDGADGADGVDGEDGTDGTDGKTILSGVGAPENATDGSLGDFYLDTESTTLYGPKRKMSIEGHIIVGWGAGLILKGADGNANVRTFKYTVDADSWTTSNNTSGATRKTLTYELAFDALTQDVHENGIILVSYTANGFMIPLPTTGLTNLGNLITRSFSTQNMSSGTTLTFYIRNSTITDATEVFQKGNDHYYDTTNFVIKVITGSVAEQLSSVRDNPTELIKEATRLGLTD